MPSRRAPRWVFWPGKLLWAPLILAGLPFLVNPEVSKDSVGQGGWRIVMTIGTPDVWVQSPATFWPGLAAVAIGLLCLWIYSADPRGGQRLTAMEYPMFSLASWVFGIIAVLAFFRTTGHVAELGTAGVDWRFLVFIRSTTLDYVVFGVAAAAWLATWLASWGLVSARWYEGATAADVA